LKKSRCGGIFFAAKPGFFRLASVKYCRTTKAEQFLTLFPPRLEKLYGADSALPSANSKRLKRGVNRLSAILFP
jgi:hypothetical protein